MAKGKSAGEEPAAARAQRAGSNRAKGEPAAEEHATVPAQHAGSDTLSATIKNAYIALSTVCGVLAAIAVFTAAYGKSGSALLVVTLVAFIVLLVVAVGIGVLIRYRSRQVTGQIWKLTGIVVIAIMVGLGAGYGAHQARPNPRAAAGTSTTTPSTSALPAPVPSQSPIATEAASPSAASSENAATGFTAQVAWTDDGGGGGSVSTVLYAFAGPNSHVHEAEYTLGESLTVICDVPNGRAIQVGPAYKGPNPPASTVWYELDVGFWVPGVYVHVDDVGAVPACS